MKKLTILLIALLTATSAFLFFACGESSYNSRYENSKMRHGIFFSGRANHISTSVTTANVSPYTFPTVVRRAP